MGPQPQTSNITKILIFVVGIIIGSLVVGAYFNFYADRSGTDKPQVTTETKGIILSISSPNDGAVVGEKTISVAGTTGKDSVVVITGVVEDKIAETSQGSFSEKVEVSEGQNKITIYAFDTATGENAQTSLNILYISEKLATNSTLIAAEHTNIEKEIDTIKKKLSTQSANLNNSAISLPKTHVFGTVIAKGNDSISLGTNDNGIKTIFFNDLTKFSIVGPKSTTTTNLEQIGVGDSVAAAGVSPEDSMGTAKFLIKMNKKTLKHHALVGKVKEITQDEIVLTLLSQKDLTYTIKITKSSKVGAAKGTQASVSDINEGDILVVSGTLDKKGLLDATNIFTKSVRSKQNQKESTKSATPSAVQ